jgi:RTX calcium-binding nonapeptide repeat (4 copies)
MQPVRRPSPLLLMLAIAALLGVLVLATAGATPVAQSGDACAAMDPSIQCGPGNNRQTAGGGELVSHAGWPPISGVLAKVLDGSGRTMVGGPANDELLGHHGNDTISGAGGKDVIWGDWDPHNNSSRQHDVLRGGAGNDFIYPGHGTTSVLGGAGNDTIRAFYGHGTIDCGPGTRDLAQIRENGAFKTRNCELIRHFCQYGSKPNGDCKQPGETLAARAVRRAR